MAKSMPTGGVARADPAWLSNVPFPVRTGESRARPSGWITVLRGKRRPIQGTSVGQHNDPSRPVSENTKHTQTLRIASPRAGL